MHRHILVPSSFPASVDLFKRLHSWPLSPSSEAIGMSVHNITRVQAWKFLMDDFAWHPLLFLISLRPSLQTTRFESLHREKHSGYPVKSLGFQQSLCWSPCKPVCFSVRCLENCQIAPASQTAGGLTHLGHSHPHLSDCLTRLTCLLETSTLSSDTQQSKAGKAF